MLSESDEGDRFLRALCASSTLRVTKTESASLIFRWNPESDLWRLGFCREVSFLDMRPMKEELLLLDPGDVTALLGASSLPFFWSTAVKYMNSESLWVEVATVALRINLAAAATGGCVVGWAWGLPVSLW